MPNKPPLSDKERSMFRQAVKGTRRLQQDQQVPSPPPVRPPLKKRQQALADKRAQATHPFSDAFEPALPDGVMKYTAAGANPYLAKQLRRGDFVPDLIVDLHGLTQQQAQRDLAVAIDQCLGEHLRCLNVIHGIGQGILRQRVPGWLMQHPRVEAFHQAPLEWGGQGALLVLVNLPV